MLGRDGVSTIRTCRQGDHQFRVIARNSDGVVSAARARWPSTVIPPFYRRWWFFAALPGVCGAHLVLWRHRVNQFLAKQAAQQAFSQQLIASQEHERRRIAAELHDSLGQRLIVINNLARVLSRRSRSPRPRKRWRGDLEEIGGGGIGRNRRDQSHLIRAAAVSAGPARVVEGRRGMIQTARDARLDHPIHIRDRQHRRRVS